MKRACLCLVSLLLIILSTGCYPTHTCEFVDGEYGRVCRYCGASDHPCRESIEVHHQAPTPDEDGYEVQICSVCGRELRRTVLVYQTVIENGRFCDAVQTFSEKLVKLLRESCEDGHIAWIRQTSDTKIEEVVLTCDDAPIASVRFSLNGAAVSAADGTVFDTVQLIVLNNDFLTDLEDAVLTTVAPNAPSYEMMSIIAQNLGDLEEEPFEKDYDGVTYRLEEQDGQYRITAHITVTV